MREEKTAVIASGGGMKCAYAAGALTALGKELGLGAPDIALASSGSTGSLMYYLSGQYDEGERAWIKFIPSPNFIRYFPFPRFNVDYLVDTVIKQYIPLDTDRLARSPSRYFVPVTDEASGATRFIGNDTWLDPHEVLRAAMAIPLFYHRHIALGSHLYMDGGIGLGTQALIEKAVAEGATRILLITNLTPKKRWAKLLFRLYAYWQREPLEGVLLDYTDRIDTPVLPNSVRGLHLSPSRPLPVGLTTRDPHKVAEAFYMGYDDVMARREEILDLLTT
ncbi:MAG: patatin-like phospholipase family protein [bacterium]